MLRHGLRYLLLLLLPVLAVYGTELTFQLAQSDKQCFYEELEKSTNFRVEFQVSYKRKRPNAEIYLQNESNFIKESKSDCGFCYCKCIL